MLIVCSDKEFILVLLIWERLGNHLIICLVIRIEFVYNLRPLYVVSRISLCAWFGLFIKIV